MSRDAPQHGSEGGGTAATFAEETGELTARRWRIGLTLYLVFAAIGSFVEGTYYPARHWWLIAAWLVQLAVVIAGWRRMRVCRHPTTAWIALASNVSVCVILALYNAVVGGDMLYVLLTYIAFMLVSSVFVPWGARFQLALNVGVIGAHSLALLAGAHSGPVPTYDFIALVSDAIFSTLGAHYIDQNRRQLFGQAQQLRDVNQRLQAAGRARTDLLTGLSHDMRTPLTVVMGYADVLAEQGLPSDAGHAVRSIAREARQLLYLADGVLDLARLEDGRLPLHRETFAVHEALDPLRETTADLVRERLVHLQWDIPSHLVLDSDAGKVREIARNLLSNAAKFTREGEIRLVASARDGGIEITVTDTGVGIAPDQLAAIFDPFHQVAPGNGPQRGGVGFGLYLVQLLVSMLGGRIAVESAPEAGSTFRVWPPLHPPLTAKHDLDLSPSQT
ncbi:MAG: HAMP domain-containing histidine kinase [Deltaproteobacteria bacterium]|nr:HAMP domain-containing histidine kinase [Deltaproteobacteria bacterium]MBI3387035.1 HAMP domain-containing histidine kinase [Deltaproteobacteria bacterium]